MSEGTSPAERKTLLDFFEKNQQQIAALQAAARAHLDGAGAAGAEGIRIVLEVTPEDQRESATDSTRCYDETYICGKTQTGYMICHVTVCMTTGPVTLKH